MKKTLPIIKSAALIVALVVIGISVTFSWFNNRKDTAVEEFSSNTIKVNDSTVSVDGEEWQNGIFFDRLKSINFLPVASDGKSFFLQRQRDENGNQIGTWVENGDHLGFVPGFDYKDISAEVLESNALACMDFKMKSRFDSNLYLDTSSKLLPASWNAETGTAEDVKDYVAGALRVAMYKIDENNRPELLFLWVPNTTYHVTPPQEVGESVTVDPVSTTIESIRLQTAADGTCTEIATENQANGYAVMEDGAYCFWGDLAKIQVTVGEGNASTTVGVDKIPLVSTKAEVAETFRIAVWFEANDRECEGCFAGGRIVSELFFKSELI